MDVDRDSSAVPSSPPPPQPKKQSSFSVPIPNGINTAVNGEGPVPPPHKSNPSSPIPTTEEEAESYKAAGNRFFKEKDYKNAIIQYTKGKLDSLNIFLFTSLKKHQPSLWFPNRPLI
jgi:DnaJ family protein C protein 7